MSKGNEAVTRQWYKDYRQTHGEDRNSLRQNMGVLFQTLAQEASVVRASRAMHHEPAIVNALDTGCGSGGNLYQLIRLGYDPSRISGIDILPESIRCGRTRYPQMRFVAGDASKMEFRDSEFDLVTEFTMFATLPDDALCAGIAKEMVRVCKPCGYLLLVDWRTPKFGDPSYRALTRKRLNELFGVDRDTRLVGVFRGALVPPVGRFLSKHIPSIYFFVAALCPFLVGQVSYVLQKVGSTGEKEVGERP